ncbi:hypothetical protein HYV57_01905 [Candidatus Peregrinibacteria bacterium]|nr:hypothetical protein [Candidatus Peregrinibacteria bacterium]
MKKNIFLWVSFLINVFFLAMVGFYFFTPYLDFAVIQKSLPRMCRFIENAQSDFNPSLCDLKNSIVPASPDLAASLDAAKMTLNNFFNLLSVGDFNAAALLYGGDYDMLRSWNPTADPNDVAELWKNGCAINGLQCMKAKRIFMGTLLTPSVFQFIVEFQKEDGSIFAAKDGNTRFEYIVNNVDNGFVVMQAPPYQE